MENWLQGDPQYDRWMGVLGVIIDTGVKGMVLLVLTATIALLMRRSSPSRRHAVWALALGGLLLLPIFSLLLPKWHLQILPSQVRSAERVSVARPLSPPAAVPAPEQSLSVQPAASPASASSGPSAGFSAVPAVRRAPLPWPFWAAAAWLAVALFALAPLVVGMAVVARLVGRARPAQGGERENLIRSASASMGLRRSPPVLWTGAGAMPMATGLLKPAVLLPDEALAWSDEKQRSVLLHELAHVRRRDCLISALARLAVALHWFNPLAWLALRRLRIEREGACDDLVLAAGERPSVYADHLLDVARTLHAVPLTSGAAVPMARRSQLETRLRAVLDAARNRKTVRWGGLIVGVLLVLGAAAALSIVKFSEARVFSSMTPEQRGEFDSWYTRKISIPPEEVRVDPYSPALMEVVGEFQTLWEKHRETALEVEKNKDWSKLQKEKADRLPEEFTAEDREKLEGLEPLLSAYRKVVQHPDYTFNVWRTTRSGTPGSQSISWIRPVRALYRLTYADALLQLESGNLDGAVESADALVAGARLDPYSTIFDLMIAINLLQAGIAAHEALAVRPLDPAARERIAGRLEELRPRLEAATSTPVNALIHDSIGLTMDARRSGLKPDFRNKTGYEIMLEAVRIQRLHLENTVLPQATSEAEREAVRQSLTVVRSQMDAFSRNHTGLKGLWQEWTNPTVAAMIFSALTGLERARQNAEKVLEDYDQLLQKYGR